MTSQHPEPPDLESLLDKARRFAMTSAHRRAQMISFVYGNTHIENPAITREMVEVAYERLLSQGAIKSGY